MEIACFDVGMEVRPPGKKLNFKTNGAILDVSEKKGKTGQRGKVCPPLPPLAEGRGGKCPPLPPQSKGRGGDCPRCPRGSGAHADTYIHTNAIRHIHT